MKIILIRHGDPNYEKDCLTELGHKQVKVAAKRLLKKKLMKFIVRHLDGPGRRRRPS